MMVRLARRRICYYGGSTVGRVVHVFLFFFLRHEYMRLALKGIASQVLRLEWLE